MVDWSMDFDSIPSGYLVAPLSKPVPPREQNTFRLKAMERASGYDQLIYSMLVQTGESSSPLSLLILGL